MAWRQRANGNNQQRKKTAMKINKTSALAK